MFEISLPNPELSGSGVVRVMDSFPSVRFVTRFFVKRLDIFQDIVNVLGLMEALVLEDPSFSRSRVIEYTATLEWAEVPRAGRWLKEARRSGDVV